MTIQWSVDNGIGMLMLDHPPQNTMTLAFFQEMQVMMSRLPSMAGLKAVIIHGNGRHYSSGADLAELLRNIDEQIMRDNYRAFVVLEKMKIPVISAIRGVCLGSAFELALFSHFRICSEDSVLGLPESTFNLMPGIGGIQRVAALAGKAKAIEIILRGITFSGADALKLGLVDAVVPKGEVLQLAVKFAKSLPGNYDKECHDLYLHKFFKTRIIQESA
jgi:enoyl-CoA hydratase/carnithine racemase